MTKYTITVDDKLWEKFKGTVNKNETLNDAIVELIAKDIEAKKRG